MVPSPDEEIIAVLNYRKSSKFVAKLMEQLYAMKRYDPSAILEYTVTGKAPCLAWHPPIDGIPWGEELVCGSGDRFFWARKVENLHVEKDEYGVEHFKWRERKRPDLRDIAEILKINS